MVDHFKTTEHNSFLQYNNDKSPNLKGSLYPQVRQCYLAFVGCSHENCGGEGG